MGAILFYVIYVIGLAIIILQPALNYESFIQVFWKGFIFGIVAYGTYNLTNMATIKNWSANVLFVDIFWGGFITAFSCRMGIYLVKKFFA